MNIKLPFNFFYSFLLLFLKCTTSSAQVKKVFGNLVNHKFRQLLPGKSVNIKETSQNVITKEDGSFFLTVPSYVCALVISLCSYSTQEATVSNR
jgi:hypothetical protein